MKHERWVVIVNNKEIFASNLNYYMNEKGKSRRDVADAIGVSYFTFTDWVKGKTYPRMNMVEKLAKYFGIKISDLIEKKTIEENPVEMAELHFEMIMDEDISEIFADFKKLDKKQKQIVKNLIHEMADAEA